MLQVSTVTTAAISEWHSATGPLAIPLTNDYLFRALLQRNNYVLKGLICSLLHRSPQEVSSVVINNPIILGEPINCKTNPQFRLGFWILLFSLNPQNFIPLINY